MSGWRNFHIWRGRLPHWRADGVVYYVRIGHSRDLEVAEREILADELLKLDGRGLDIRALCVLPSATECIFQSDVEEFFDSIERAKTRAGKKIIKVSGERWPPIYKESFDRIVRDDVELEETLGRILISPVVAELCEAPENYAQLFISGS